MTDEIKQRLVGASVLAVCAAIVLPWLFGNPKDPRGSIQASFDGTPVPVALEAAEIVLVAPSPRVAPTTAPSPPPRQTPAQPVAATPRPTPSPAPTASPTPRPRARATVRPAPTPQVAAAHATAPATRRWILQLASYRNRSAADDFLKRLHKAGHQAYRESVTISGKTYYRVRLRVAGSKDVAQKLQRDIERKYRIQAQLFASR